MIETEQETDGRWIAEITDQPGVMAYGATKEEAIAAALAFQLRVKFPRTHLDAIGTTGCKATVSTIQPSRSVVD